MVVSTANQNIKILLRVDGIYYSDFSDTVKVIW